MGAIQWVTISVSNNFFICERILPRFSFTICIYGFIAEKDESTGRHTWNRYVLQTFIYC
jgi:hypothetical protein